MRPQPREREPEGEDTRFYFRTLVTSTEKNHGLLVAALNKNTDEVKLLGKRLDRMMLLYVVGLLALVAFFGAGVMELQGIDSRKAADAGHRTLEILPDIGTED